MGVSDQEFSAADRISSWKEIANYLKRDVTTVQRWERTEGLPVHRHLHRSQGSVYAYRSEIDAWLRERSRTWSTSNGATEGPERIQQDWLKGLAPGKRKLAWATGCMALILLGWWGGASLMRRQAPNDFHAPGWVLIAGFVNETGNPDFDGTLEHAIATELAGSRRIRLVPRERIGDTLRLMKQPMDARIDRKLAIEICRRDTEIQFLLAGRIARSGNVYTINADLVDPETGRSAETRTATAEDVTRVWTAVRDIADWVRTGLGENPAARSRGQSEKVSTTSLRALKLYTEADTLMRRGDQSGAMSLLRQALGEDSSFASAHLLLAWTLHEQGLSGYEQHTDRALELSLDAPERERLFIVGSRYQMLGKRDEAIETYKTLLDLHPDHFWALNNLHVMLGRAGRHREALPYRRRAADSRPNDFQHQSQTAYVLAYTEGHLRSARPYLERARQLMSFETGSRNAGGMTFVRLAPAFERWAERDIAGSLREIDTIAEDVRTGKLAPEPDLNYSIGFHYLSLGKLHAALEFFTPGAALGDFGRAWIRFFSDDMNSLRTDLDRVDRNTAFAGFLHTPVLRILLIRAGLLEQELRLVRPKLAPAPNVYRSLIEGERALARGNADGAYVSLADGVAGIRNRGMASYFLGSESLARIWIQRGDLAKAIAVLEAASPERASAAFNSPGPIFWLRNQTFLADLYRRSGRVPAAARVEADLYSHLRYADADHPIVRRLAHHAALR